MEAKSLAPNPFVRVQDCISEIHSWALTDRSGASGQSPYMTTAVDWDSKHGMKTH